MDRLKRKIDIYLQDWKKDSDRLPLIVKGARQKGAIYENIVSDMLVKEGYDLFYYKDDSKK